MSRHVSYPARLLESRAARLILAGGALATLVGLLAAPQRTWATLLLVGYGLTMMGVMGGFLRALQYAANGPWDPAVRALPRLLSALLPLGAVILAAVLLARPSLYPPLGDHASPFKELWLARPVFLARSGLYLGLWLAGIAALAGRMDATKGAFWTVVFGASAPFASLDWIMALEAGWYSTMFGVYAFCGAVIAALAALILLGLSLRARGFLSEHYAPRDAATLLMGLCAFWMYIWFSQYMLIWYANIPEETVHYVRRLSGAWQPLFVLNLLLNGAIPFVVLLPREAKQSPTVLARVAWVVLAGRWLDLYLMIFPVVGGGQPVIGFPELGVSAAAAVLAAGWLRDGARRLRESA